MPYVDGFLLPIPKKNLRVYKAMAAKACKIWKEYGALDYKECVGEDLKTPWGVPFPKAAKAKAGETIVFSWITYKSRKQRDAVNKKIMSDPRIKEMMDPKNPPFDMKRMCYGGFEVIVEM
ncbi:MAG: DUF1428 domain-containing protein [Phycisphaerae bacterium]|nr:DUF1428 domain-containing protein [Phycisphaerae bacterium]